MRSWILVPVMAACTPAATVSGELDGEAPAFTAAFYGDASEGSRGAFVVYLSSADITCDAQRELQDAVNAFVEDGRPADGSGAIEDLYRSLFPEQFWSALFLAGTEDYAADVDVRAETGETATASVTRQLAWLDADYFTGAGDPADYLQRFPGKPGGELTLRRSEEGGPLSGTFDLSFTDAEEQEAGDLTGTFNATPCGVLDETADQLRPTDG